MFGAIFQFINENPNNFQMRSEWIHDDGLSVYLRVGRNYTRRVGKPVVVIANVKADREREGTFQEFLGLLFRYAEVAKIESVIVENTHNPYLLNYLHRLGFKPLIPDDPFTVEKQVNVDSLGTNPDRTS
jgi:hypothetical protein